MAPPHAVATTDSHEARRQTLNANIIFLLNKRGGRGGTAGLLAVAVWLICTSHKKFNFISPFLISYSARRIWRKQSTLDNNYDASESPHPCPSPPPSPSIVAPEPGFQILHPYAVSRGHENNAEKKRLARALFVYYVYVSFLFLSPSLSLSWQFVSLLHEKRGKQTANNSKWIQLKQSQS